MFGTSKKNKIFAVCSFLLVVLMLFSENVDSGEISTDSYEISLDSINQRIKIGNYKEVPLIIKNNKATTIGVSLSLDDNLTELIKLSEDKFNLERNSEKKINLTFLADKLGFYTGVLSITGGIVEKIPINFSISEIVGVPIEAIAMEVESLTKKAYLGESLRYKVYVQDLLGGDQFNVTLYYSMSKLSEGNMFNSSGEFFSESEAVAVDTSTTLIKKIELPDSMEPDEYVLNVRVDYLGLSSYSSIRFILTERLMNYNVLGILPLGWLIVIMSFLIISLIVYMIYRKRMAKKKRYKSKLDYSLLPKPGPRSVKVGKIAETNKDAYFDIDQLTMHTLIAGSTGGGKTVSAEVLVEEALDKGCTVFVFDPTAQWTGFLRKCVNKKMLDIYPKFGLKKTDAKAFNGNVHQMLNARQIVDVKKYMIPGELHSFAINKLDPADIDILVANTMREIFQANLPESKELKLLLIFDEVHRLLPKFGGTGQGFLQIERAAREFRKWGVGLMLISQVLTDFVGQTKANINTEIQMRTRDQGDLDRIKNKYGAYMLQSLLKASTGTGMIENPAYNTGNPYFISFRPLFHEHARLADDILESYNKYNDIIDDIEFEIDQLEALKKDVFDLRLELKMALDKVKAGAFNMVDIYLEGLKPRIDDMWKKLGKKPKKREIKLVDEAELQKELEKAKKAREKYEKDNAEAGGKPAPAEVKLVKPDKKMPTLELTGGFKVKTTIELIDVINTMEDADFAKHVNAKKNDIADWARNGDVKTADKIAKETDKMKIIELLEGINLKEDDEKDEKKEGDKKEEKKEDKK
ncbi:MAG: helicase HerA-like domain-containing protein [Nanoarchaeota archaeon]|nr:helicase HerA-like domain-containing protein [Nanoarchaeota archaeon]